VADGTNPGGTRIERWLEERMPGYRYGGVLVLLAMTFVVMAVGPPDGYTRVLTVTLQGFTLMATLLASRVGRRLFRIAAAVTLVSFVAAVASVISTTSRDPSGAFFLLNVLLVVSVPVVIARALWRRQVVDIHTVMGAICIYVLLGMMFAFVYAAVDNIGNAPFFVQTAHATTPDFLYFSFVTQTTVGYGDFTARSDLGHALSVLEALGGQLYLVTVIAVLVSRLSAIGSRSVARPQPQSQPDDATVGGQDAG
jgi:hypothetical protein